MRQTKKAVAKYAGASAFALLLATSVFAAPAQWQRQSRDSGAQPAASELGTISHAVSQITADQGNRQAARQQEQQQQQQPQQQAQRSQPQRSGSYDRNNQQSQRQQQQQPQRQYTQQQPQRDNYRASQRVNGSGRITSVARDRDGYRVQLDRGGAFWIPSSRLGTRARDLRVGVSISLGGIFDGGMINVDAVTWPAGYQQGYVSGIVQRIDYRTGTLTLRDDYSGSLIAVDIRSMRTGNLRPGDLVTLSGNWMGGGVFDAYRIDSIS